MSETTLQFIHCEKCNNNYMVGIGGKDITNSNTGGGKMDKIPYMTIGNDI